MGKGKKKNTPAEGGSGGVGGDKPSTSAASAGQQQGGGKQKQPKQGQGDQQEQQKGGGKQTQTQPPTPSPSQQQPPQQPQTSQAGGKQPHPQQQQQQQPPQVAGAGAADVAVVSSAPKQRNKYKKQAPADAAAPVATVAVTAAVAAGAAAARAAGPPLAASASTSSSSVAAAAAMTRSPSLASVASVASSVGSLALIPTAAPMILAGNKGAGTCGRQLLIDVNYLALNLSKLVPTIYHYDITIEPNMPKRFMPKVFETFRKLNFPNIFIAYDGQKSAFAPQILKLDSIKERKVMFKDENEASTRAYLVAMKEVKATTGGGHISTKGLMTYQNTRQFDLPARALQALEVILKSVFLMANGVSVGRAFYRPVLENNRRLDLGDYFDLWTGLFQSTVLGSQPYLNVDIAHKAFPRPIPLIDMLQNMRLDPRSPMDTRAQMQLTQQLKGLRLSYVRPNAPESLKSYKFGEFGPPPAQHSFQGEKEGDKRMTVLQYFATKYKLVLKYPNLPCVRTSPVEKGNFLPFEFCSVADNQAVMRKCTEVQTRNMIKSAATSTDVRRSKIMNLLREIRHNDSPTLKQFGVGVGTDFTTVKARVLNAPTLEYAGKKTCNPMRGVWNPAGEFLYPVQLTKWAVLIFEMRTQDRLVYDFIGNICRTGSRSFNMRIDEQPAVRRLKFDQRGNCTDADIDKMMNELRDDGCQLLMCIISNFGDIYARVKQAAEIRCGILTQCIKEQTVMRKGNDQSTVSNILLKVNAKMNGTNHKFADIAKLPVQRRPLMVIGADVTHPSPEQTRIPSVVGVAVSYDVQTFRYRMCWRLQSPKQEMIEDLEGILKEQLILFQQVNKVLPEVLFYYRDGVSDGQFQEVLRVELNAMHRACAGVKPGYKPKVVFVVVQKRHHTRFFPKTPNPRDRNNNVEAGTIVDSQITHPNETQFFLVSHASIQGVAKPTKYCLLRDDLNMTINDLETFTYNLCHLFTRCNRAVSYPAPTYYAHLAAYRGRVYIEGGRQEINMDKLQQEYDRRRTNVRITNGNPMYFV